MIIENRRQLIECLKQDAIANKRKSIHRKYMQMTYGSLFGFYESMNIQGVKNYLVCHS